MEVKVEDYAGFKYRITIDGEEIFNDSPDPMAITMAFADYLSDLTDEDVDVDWEVKDPNPEEHKELDEMFQDDQSSDNNDPNSNEENTENIYIQYENEIDDGSEDYGNNLSEEDL